MSPETTDLTSILPAKYAAPITALFLILTTLGRIITALKNDPSFMGAIRSVFMGSSTTTKSLPNNSEHELVTTGDLIPTVQNPRALYEAMQSNPAIKKPSDDPSIVQKSP